MVNIKTIDAKVLSRMFLAGAKNLEAKKEWINELNVFPVPDGDTGTNMTMTIMSAAAEVSALTEPDMETLAKAISSGSLRGARGNSGVILSQLLRGFTRGVRKSNELDAITIAAAMERAVETAYKAVMKPKEGTILTVAKEASLKAAEIAPEAEELEPFFKEVFEHAEYTLSRTPEMLPVLKEAGVVDSGGQGLLEVLRGAIDGFLGKEVDYSEFEKPAGAAVTKISPQAEADIKFGYCTEFIILLNKPMPIEEEHSFKEFLTSIGDSIVLVADDEIGHRVWVIDGNEEIETIREQFENIPSIYIADGHHRAASAVKVGLKRREEHPDYDGTEEFNYFLSVVFPYDQLKILAYNRVVHDLNGMDEHAFIASLKFNFELMIMPGFPCKPVEKHCMGMYVGGNWYHLKAWEDVYEKKDVVGQLDVSILQEKVLTPILGIGDPRTDQRIRFVGGSHKLSELAEIADKTGGVAFAMFPTAMEDLMQIADESKLMPPKSTWFEPKLRSGLFLHML